MDRVYLTKTEIIWFNDDDIEKIIQEVKIFRYLKDETLHAESGL